MGGCDGGGGACFVSGCSPSYVGGISLVCVVLGEGLCASGVGPAEVERAGGLERCDVGTDKRDKYECGE